MEDKIKKVISLGAPLPDYDYNYGKFTIELAKNIQINGGTIEDEEGNADIDKDSVSVMGITMSDMFDTFEEALDGLIKYYTTDNLT